MKVTTQPQTRKKEIFANFALVLLLILSTFVPTFAQTSQNVELVGRILFGTANATFVQGDYTYTCAGASLLIIDITKPESPNLEGYIYLPDMAEDVYVVGKYAYVAVDDSGLHIIDISSPSNPLEVGYYDTPGRAWNVYISGCPLIGI